MNLVFLDTETYSPIPIQAGTYRYAEEAEIIMWQYAINDGPVQISYDNEFMVEQLKTWCEDSEIVIQNSNFDRTVIREVTSFNIPPEKIFDTMACALSHGFPGGLEMLCEILGLPQDKAKDRQGKALIRFFCSPDSQGHRNYKYDFPTQWAAFEKYGEKDIEAVREIYKRLPKWNFRSSDRKVWCLDQKINDRGVRIDTQLVDAAIRECKKAKIEFDMEAIERTGGEVSSFSRRDILLEHILKEYDIELPDLQGSTIERRLEDPSIPSGLKEILKLRYLSNKTSVAKYNRVKKGISVDLRLRGLLQFSGAPRTRRWSGRLFQPQNLPRPTLKDEAIEDGIKILKADAWDFLGEGSIMDLTTSAIRGVIIAPPNKKLVIADLSNIEGRVLAWLAEEYWKIAAFRKFDREQDKTKKKALDIYNLSFSKVFGVQPELVSEIERQIGKVMELAFGYQGAIGACVTFALAYGIDLEAKAFEIIDRLPKEAIADSRDFINWYKEKKFQTFGLSDTALVVWNCIKQLWRDSHGATVGYWGDLEIACKKAINLPNQIFEVNKHKISRTGEWLRISLPSGNCLTYPAVRLEDGKITYMGLDQYTRKWSRLSTYGGKLAENATQSLSRDILVCGMLNAEQHGYQNLLTIHDEIMAEVPDLNDYNAEKLSELMSMPPPWALDLPLAAKGFDCYRYRKG